MVTIPEHQADGLPEVAEPVTPHQPCSLYGVLPAVQTWVQYRRSSWAWVCLCPPRTPASPGGPAQLSCPLVSGPSQLWMADTREGAGRRLERGRKEAPDVFPSLLCLGDTSRRHHGPLAWGPPAADGSPFPGPCSQIPHPISPGLRQHSLPHSCSQAK